MQLSRPRCFPGSHRRIVTRAANSPGSPGGPPRTRKLYYKKARKELDTTFEVQRAELQQLIKESVSAAMAQASLEKDTRLFNEFRKLNRNMMAFQPAEFHKWNENAAALQHTDSSLKELKESVATLGREFASSFQTFGKQFENLGNAFAELKGGFKVLNGLNVLVIFFSALLSVLPAIAKVYLKN